jgi:predicted ferric reductase
MIGVLLLLLLVALTIWIRLPYAKWLKTHQWMGVAYVAGSLHAILLQTDWYLILILAIGSYAWLYRLVLYRWWEPRHAGELTGVAAKSGVTELTIRLEEPVAAQAAQFVFLSVSASSAGISREAHPFSISGILDERTIRISAKALGDYTRQLALLKPGDPVTVTGPYGRFGARRSLVRGPMLWVAGGIGITPFLSLLQQEKTLPSSAPVTLVWSVKQRSEALYAEEIENAVEALPHVHFHLHVTEESGRLDAARLAELSKEPRLAAVSLFLCGPSAMMHGISTQLRRLGLPRGNVVMEEFSIR